MKDSLEEQIGRFQVTTTASRVKAFCDALGMASDTVPLTYPMTFLARHDIAAALARGLPSDHLPIHRSQSFTRLAPLQLDQTYVLDLLRKPARGRSLAFFIEASLSDRAGHLMQQFQSTVILKSARDDDTA
jgi:hypothetical protein